jgi:surfactin synthase thioesterase subunit
MPPHVTGRTAWLPRPPSAAPAGRVFCIPYAGCGTSLFRNWPREQDSVEFLPVELPGRETRLAEPVAGTFEELAGAMIKALAPYLDVPFAFFGHCWSALAAYEATARLHRAGLPRPARLFVSSQVAPQDGPVGRMLGMNEEELSEEVSTTIRALGGQPHPELVAIYAEVLRADVDASRQYIVRAPAPLDCPITAIGWTDDGEVRPERMAGWSACGDTTFEVFIGRHYQFIEAPPELLTTLSAGLGIR